MSSALTPSNLSASQLATDTRSMDRLRVDASRDPKSAIREAAKQFEAVFMREVLKSMREATMKSGLFEGPGLDMQTDMLDQQLVQSMAGRTGLADLIAKQLSQSMKAGDTNTPVSTEGLTATKAKTSAAAPAFDLGRVANATAGADESKRSFLRTHWAAASAAERTTGIPALNILGQAAHESAWGAREIRHADGTSAHNLFGIKAGPNWTGKVAEVVTTEYENGVARKQVARFRAYDSYADAFADYAKLLSSQPRYAQVAANGQSAHGFASGLQRAGYATDPEYANKLARVINTAVRVARANT